jgi:DNA repair protein RadC
MISLKTLHHSPKLAELKVSYKRRNRAQPDTSNVITSPETAAEYLRKIWDRDRIELVEDFYVVCLNGAHEAIGWVLASPSCPTRVQIGRDSRWRYGNPFVAARS